jgi:hypothetical protein
MSKPERDCQGKEAALFLKRGCRIDTIRHRVSLHGRKRGRPQQLAADVLDSWPSFSVLATTAPYQDAHSVSAHHVTESPRLLIASLVMFPSGNAEKF